MPVRPHVSPIDLASKRRSFEIDLSRRVDLLMSTDLSDKTRMDRLAGWFDDQLRRGWKTADVREFLADKKSVENLKRRFPVAAKSGYTWVRTVIDRAARTVTAGRAPKPPGPAPVPHHGLAPVGTTVYMTETPHGGQKHAYLADARAGRRSTAKRSVTVNGRRYVIPEQAWLDDRVLAAWMVQKGRKDRGFVDAVWLEMHRREKGGRDWVALAAARAYGILDREGRRPARKDLEIPFGKFSADARAIPDPLRPKGFRGAKLSELLSGRIGGQKTLGYLRFVNEIRHKRVPGTTQTHGEMYRRFYAEFDRSIKNRADLRDIWSTGIPDVDDDVSPQDARRFGYKHEREYTRAVLKHRLRRQDLEPGVLRTMYEQGVLTQGEFYAVSGNISDIVGVGDHARHRAGGFAPSDVQINPWWFVHNHLTGLSRNIVGVNRYDRFARQARTPDGRPEPTSSHFFQQQTYPYSMTRKYQRYLKEYDPDRYTSEDYADAARVVFAERQGRARWDPENRRWQPGVKSWDVRDEAVFGMTLERLPYLTRRIMREAARKVLEERTKQLLVNQRIEDARASILGTRERLWGTREGLGSYGRDPVAEIFGESMRRNPHVGRGEGAVSSRELLEDAKVAGFSFQKDIAGAGDEGRGPTWSERISRAQTRDELRIVQSDFWGRFGQDGVKGTRESETFAALEDQFRVRWNAVTLPPSKRS